MNSALKVYKASAGSGKTFTLAVEYIKLLIENPIAYRHILAVTFTKKATGEMKERILSQLFGIANSLVSSEGYFASVRSSFPYLTNEEIRNKANIALELILHDYSKFRIQTIDSFFQTILRSLARELELSGDVAITLDGDKLLEEAVDLLIMKLTPASKEMGWLVEYIEEHLSNDKSWRINDAVKNFAKNILSEVYQEEGEELRAQIDANDGALLADYRKEIKSIEKEIIAEATQCADRFFAIAGAAALNMEDFYHKNSGIWGYFSKMQKGEFPDANSYVLTCKSTPEKISKSKSLSCAAREEIVMLIEKGINIRERNLPILNSCRLSVMRFHQLRLLNSIANILQEENNRENRFLLAQTTFLLGKMITGNTSFIFEKTGVEIHNILIDEFQDTSALQWKSFKILLNETLSRNSLSLIVGDVKQSIYRWRNSDWSILNNLEKQFPYYPIEIKTLNVNRRSERRIIEFNNRLFTAAAQQISEKYSQELGKSGDELTRAYSDVAQGILPEKPEKGYVEVRMLQNEDKDFKICAQEQLMTALEVMIKEKNIRPRDITILVRYNREITPIAEAFNKKFPEYSIISDEAYSMSSSVAAKLLISALKYISSPKDRINLAFLVKNIGKTSNKDHTDIVVEITERMLPSTFLNEIENLRRQPVYEILERLITILNLQNIKGEEAFIFSFLDYAAKFLKENPASIDDFITFWDDELSCKSIPATESDGVRILSIHKSKGLEFHTVIIPFCTWELADNFHRNILWCKPKIAPFNQISLLPIDRQNCMLNSIYNEEYNQEYLCQLVDNLNILYVACTRAAKNLIIYSDAGKGRGDTISKRLPGLLENIGLKNALYDKEEKIFTYGTMVPTEERKEKKDNNPFTRKPVACTQRYVSHRNKLTFRQSRNFTRFIAQEKNEKKTLEYLAKGELLHDLLSKLRTGDELQRQMTKMRLEGLIATDTEFENISELIKKALSNPVASDWFSGKYKLYNECTILYKKENEHINRRPDRVMIYNDQAIVVDFKFGSPKTEYAEQIREYVSLLKRMGYSHTKGYLWYIYSNQIEEIDR